MMTIVRGDVESGVGSAFSSRKDIIGILFTSDLSMFTLLLWFTIFAACVFRKGQGD